MNEHRHIQELIYSEENGLIIYFKDGSHTFIPEHIIEQISNSNEYYYINNEEE